MPCGSSQQIRFRLSSRERATSLEQSRLLGNTTCPPLGADRAFGSRSLSASNEKAPAAVRVQAGAKFLLSKGRGFRHVPDVCAAKLTYSYVTRRYVWKPKLPLHGGLLGNCGGHRWPVCYT
jgi:hypothetical protein